MRDRKVGREGGRETDGEGERRVQKGERREVGVGRSKRGVEREEVGGEKQRKSRGRGGMRVVVEER
ncbi:hypothetical protein [Thiolapillus sp.]|uniref:hypothetical protein n=1 Tax=Thiolapillus sp. TaxID=2017437 RepID=UPI0025CB902D|nr:hypothetical protein [Thiolapillus sp.]